MGFAPLLAHGRPYLSQLTGTSPQGLVGLMTRSLPFYAHTWNSCLGQNSAAIPPPTLEITFILVTGCLYPLCPADIPFLLPTRPPHDVLLLKWKKCPGHFASFLSERAGQSSSSLPNGLMVSVRHLAAAGWLCNWFSMPLALPKLGGFPTPPSRVF